MNPDQGSEYFVDVQRTEIPARDTWSDMNFNQLMDLKLMLLDKLAMAKRAPVYLVPLNRALAEVEALISKALSGPKDS